MIHVFDVIFVVYIPATLNAYKNTALKVLAFVLFKIILCSLI
jgi:hypothetical protein